MRNKRTPGVNNSDYSVLAVLSRSDGFGGAERSTIEMAAEALESGEFWCLAAREKGPGEISTSCEEQKVPYRTVNSVWDMVRLIREVQPSLVWAFGLRWSMQLRLLLPICFRLHLLSTQPSLFVAQRGLDIWRRPIHNLLDRSTQRLVDRYVANSEAAGTVLREQVGIDLSRISVLHSGLSSSWLKPVSLRKPNNPPIVMIVGNDRPEKDYPTVIGILERLQCFPWNAVIYSDHSEHLNKLLADSKLTDRVTVVCGVRLKPSDFDKADVLLHCAIAECFPRAVMEARARGLKIVATDVGDVAALVNDHDLFTPRDVTAGSNLLRRHLEGLQSVRHTPEPKSVVSTHTEVAQRLRLLFEGLA